MDHSDYKLAQSQKMLNTNAMKHMQEKVHHHLRQLLLARFILLKLFVEVAENVQRGLHEMNLRHAWVLLQILPVKIFGEDIFETLTNTLCSQDFIDLEMDIKQHYFNLSHILG